MRRGAVTVIVLTALAAAVMPALAADEVTITASDFRFTPPQVTIAVGDTVRFANSGGTHNFAFADGPAYPASPTGPGAEWNNVSRTFTQAGSYAFVCDEHPGMTGSVTVAAATQTPTPTPTPTATPGPDPPGQGGGAQLEVRTLRMTASTFCTRRGPRCRRPGVKMKIDLSQSAEVTGILSRRPLRGTAGAKRFGRVDFGTVAAGARTLKFTKNAAGRRLTAGRYTLKVTIGSRSPQTLRFKVR